jgi:hypothetical protein
MLGPRGIAELGTAEVSELDGQRVGGGPHSMVEVIASPAPGAMVEESPRTSAASVLAGLFAADEPTVDKHAGPGPFRRRKGASMNKGSSPMKVTAMPYDQPSRPHVRPRPPRGRANPTRVSPQGPSASCATSDGGFLQVCPCPSP